MKITFLFFTIIFLYASNPELCYSQKDKGSHSFKIIGTTRLKNIAGFEGDIAVDYDLFSPNHLFISFFKKNQKIGTKTQFRFTEEIFELIKASDYIAKKELVVDGIHTIYRENESIENELLFKDELLQQETRFYPDGIKQSLSSGDGKILNGEFKVWHPNGQLSFSGNYKNNLKDGEFQLFDKSGILVTNGVYQDGKLLNGKPVVQDRIYENPDKKAQLIDGEKAFNDYLKMKSADFKSVKRMDKDEVRIFNLELTIDKTGGINKLEIVSRESPSDQEIMNSVFKEFHGYSAALVEDVPVRSIFKLNLILSYEGLQKSLERKDSHNNPVYLVVEEMPEFPGGEVALRRFLASTVRYPVEAQENGIQGKVLVSYVIQVDGSITNISVFKGANPFLDAEAVRVVKNMPKWIPGHQDGKPVSVSYTVPINFVLQ